MSACAALITGANSGIGLATAQLLVERGWKVYGAVRTAASGRQLQQAATNVTPVVLNVTDAESVGLAREWLDRELSDRGLSALINNAGVASPAPLECASLETVRAEIETNALGALRVTQAFLPLLRRATGRVFFLGSPLASKTRELCGGYAASKAALRSFADTLRIELAPSGVGVCCVEADKVTTPLWAKAAAALEQTADAEGYETQMAAAKRLTAAGMSGEGFVEPEIVAEAIWGALNAAALPPEVRVP